MILPSSIDRHQDPICSRPRFDLFGFPVAESRKISAPYCASTRLLFVLYASCLRSKVTRLLCLQIG